VDEDADEVEDAVLLGGVNVGRLMEGGSVIEGRKDEVAVSFVTANHREPISSREGIGPGTNVIVSVVMSDSMRLTISTRPTEVLRVAGMTVDPANTVRLAVAFESTDVVKYRAEARNWKNI